MARRYSAGHDVHPNRGNQRGKITLPQMSSGKGKVIIPVVLPHGLPFRALRASVNLGVFYHLRPRLARKAAAYAEEKQSRPFSGVRLPSPDRSLRSPVTCFPSFILALRVCLVKKPLTSLHKSYMMPMRSVLFSLRFLRGDVRAAGRYSSHPE